MRRLARRPAGPLTHRGPSADITFGRDGAQVPEVYVNARGTEYLYLAADDSWWRDVDEDPDVRLVDVRGAVRELPRTAVQRLVAAGTARRCARPRTCVDGPGTHWHTHSMTDA